MTDLDSIRKASRQRALADFNYNICLFARHLCYLVRANRAVLDAEDIRDCCGFIGGLCSGAGCGAAGDLCAEAAEAVAESERRHLELCEQSCSLCCEGKAPAEPRLIRISYVT